MEQIDNTINKNIQNNKIIFENIKFVKESLPLLYFSIMAMLLIFDYFIFTDVLNLNQAYFFNNLLTIVANEQPILIVFILSPIIFALLLIFLPFKIHYEYLNKFFKDNYKYLYKIFNSLSILFKLFLFIFGIFIILFGDLLIFTLLNYIYNLFDKTFLEMSLITLLFSFYIFYLFYNTLVFYLILLFSSTIILKIRNIHFLPSLIFILSFFKLLIYLYHESIPFFKDIDINVKESILFIMFNSMVFIPVIAEIISRNFIKHVNKNKINKGNILFSILFGIIAIIYINFLFAGLKELYMNPYTKKDFWKNIPINSLNNGNFSLLISPLKIIQNNKMIIDIKDIKNKLINKNQQLKNEMKEKFNKKNNYFYIPFQDYRIVFIEDDNSDKILTIFGKFKNEKLINIIDVGFINLKPIQQKKG